MVISFKLMKTILLRLHEGTQEMPQSQSTALQKHQKKEKFGASIYKDKTNDTYEITDVNNEELQLERLV